MDLSNLLIEVRTSSLDLVGAISTDDIRLDAEVPRNAVGNWRAAVRKTHPLADDLMAPGAGIVVTDTVNAKVLFSGSALKPVNAESVDVHADFVVIQGVTDEQVLEDMLAWPDPAVGDVAAQSRSHDTRTGPAETVMHQFVSANFGPTASPERINPRVAMGEDLGRGTQVTRSARFDNMLKLLQDIARTDDITFRMVQVDGKLEFRTSLKADQGRLVRLGADVGGVVSNRLARSVPGATRVIVGGSGGNTARVLHEAVSDDSLAAEEDWGRRIERFVDRQGIVSSTDLEQLGQETLSASAIAYSARIEPTVELREEFGESWSLGDTVVIEIDEREHVVPVNAFILKVDENGLRVGAVFGGEGDLRSAGTSVTDGVDAGRLTEGSSFVVNLGVKSKLTLGDAFTDGVIETHNYDGSSVGVRMSKAGLRAKGAVLEGSTFRTNTGFDDITIEPGNASVPAAMKFYSDGAYYDSASPASLSCFDSTEGSAEVFYVRLQGAKISGITTTPRIDALTQRFSGGAVDATINYYAGGASGGAGYHTFMVDGSMNFRVSSSEVKTYVGFYDSLYNGSSGQAATWNVNGRIVRQSSSERYKEHISTLSLEESRKLLAVRPARFKWREEWEMGDDWWAGVIAEEMDAAGATLWVTYDPDGRPNGVRYPELTAGLLGLVQDLDARVASLEEQLGAA